MGRAMNASMGDPAVEAILTEASEAVSGRDWIAALRLAALADALDPGNTTAAAFRRIAESMQGGAVPAGSRSGLVHPVAPMATPSTAQLVGHPTALPRHVHSHDMEHVLASAATLAPFSTVAGRLLELLDDDLSSAEDVARVAATDPALTARILRAANSAFYQRRIRVGTMREAITVLGGAEVRRLVLSTCVVGAMPPPNYLDHGSFWRFSLTVALLADLIARAEGDISGEAFTAGILHNIGLLVLDQYCPEGLHQVRTLTGPGLRRLHDRERAVFGFSDAELGGRLAALWHAPLPVRQAIEMSGLRREDVTDRHRVAAALIRARIFARAQGMSDGLEESPPRNPGSGFLPAKAQARLNQFGRWDDFLQRIDGLLEAADA